MGHGVLDFEHDTPYVVSIDLLGLKYSFTNNHVSYFEAHITTDPQEIKIYPNGFKPLKVKEGWECERCKPRHWMLPDGYYVPPVYDLAHVVVGQKITITLGPRWDVLKAKP